MLGHRTLYLHGLAVASLFKYPETVVDLHTIPLFHANGWGRPQASTLLGVKQIMVRRFEPTGVFRLIQEHHATDMSLVPTMANALLNAPDRQRRRAMAGWSVPGIQVRVVDPEMHDVPRDMQSIGEVVASGDHIMEGYFREPDITASVMSGPWFHTGDMAVWDEEGFIHIVDRKKEIIISGGENISSLEVEKAIFAHPEVFECAVVAAPDEKWGEVPVAVVVRKPGSTLTSDDLLEFLKLRLGKFKLPRVIEFMDEALPKTGTGKIRKLVLRERFWAGREKRVQG
jgi:fatty-acyl-CoA synthase